MTKFLEGEPNVEEDAQAEMHMHLKRFLLRRSSGMCVLLYEEWWWLRLSKVPASLRIAFDEEFPSFVRQSPATGLPNFQRSLTPKKQRQAKAKGAKGKGKSNGNGKANDDANAWVRARARQIQSQHLHGSGQDKKGKGNGKANDDANAWVRARARQIQSQHLHGSGQDKKGKGRGSGNGGKAKGNAFDLGYAIAEAQLEDNNPLEETALQVASRLFRGDESDAEFQRCLQVDIYRPQVLNALRNLYLRVTLRANHAQDVMVARDMDANIDKDESLFCKRVGQMLDVGFSKADMYGLLGPNDAPAEYIAIFTEWVDVAWLRHLEVKAHRLAEARSPAL